MRFLGWMFGPTTCTAIAYFILPADAGVGVCIGVVGLYLVGYIDGRIVTPLIKGEL